MTEQLFQGFEDKNTSLEKFLSAFRDVGNYNSETQRNISNAHAGSGISGKEETEIYHRLSFQQIKRLHEMNLLNAGIEISGLDENNETNEEKASKIISEIKSTSAFADFASRIKAEKMNAESAAILLLLLNNLNDRILVEISKNTGSKTKGETGALIADLMIKINFLIKEYKRLDPENIFKFKNSVLETENYYRWYKEGRLRERFLEQRFGLNYSFEEWTRGDRFPFNPTNWQRDTHPKTFKENWDTIVSFMAELKKYNEDMFDENLPKLLKAIEYAKGEIEYHFYAVHFNEEDGPDEYLPILEENYHKLRALEFLD